MFTIQSIMANLLGALSLAMFVLAIVAVPSQVVHADDDPCHLVECPAGQACFGGDCVTLGLNCFQCKNNPSTTCTSNKTPPCKDSEGHPLYSCVVNPGGGEFDCQNCNCDTDPNETMRCTCR